MSLTIDKKTVQLELLTFNLGQTDQRGVSGNLYIILSQI